MFKIRGADGKEYGPVAVEQLRQWVREGRAGGQTQVCPDGAAAWVALSSLPEFSAEFQPATPATAVTSRIPPVVATVAWAMFAVTGISALLLLVNLVSILNLPSSANFSPGAEFYLHWAVAVVSLPVRVVNGVGLLRRRAWAHQLAIGFGAVMTLYGAFGVVQMVGWWIGHPDVFPGILRSPMYVISSLWSILVLLFNVLSVVLLLSRDVRQFFASQKSGPAA